MSDVVAIPLDLFARLERAGLDVDAILRRANLPRSRFSVARPEGTTAEFFALWRAVEDQSGADASLGLRLGMEALPDETNVVSLAAMHSSTLGEGLRKLARYKRLVCPERITIDVENGEARCASTGCSPTVRLRRCSRTSSLLELRTSPNAER